MTLEMQVLVLRLVLIIGLYLFLLAVAGVALRELRATARPETLRAPGSTVGQRVLVVVDAGNTPLEAGDTFPLRPVTSLGRDMANTIVLPDPGASAEHALISVRDGHWWLEDLGSTNGTFLNGIRLSEPAIIAPGDVIRVGHVQLKME
ncbi:MAG: FHA domain-containing protein [Chloroflexi bacterium]|nr:MAG: FHA domain-containing protein [Chloroflexota bacterium]